MARDVVEPEQDEEGWERHPAWGMIGASRVSNSHGAVLFDSEIRHGHYVTIRLVAGSRKRDLNRDWLHGEKTIVEVAMSEAQWAAFVSSMGVGSGVACTIEFRDSEGGPVPGMPFAPRLQESMDEVRGAADAALEKIREAFRVAEERPNKGNMRALGFAIANAPSNMTFAAKSLGEHAENVVQKARADIEAMVVSKAQQLGLEPADLGLDRPALSAGEEPGGEQT